MKNREISSDKVGLTSFKVNRTKTLDLKKQKNQVVITMNCSKAIPIPGFQQICSIMEPYKNKL